MHLLVLKGEQCAFGLKSPWEDEGITALDLRFWWSPFSQMAKSSCKKFLTDFISKRVCISPSKKLSIGQCLQCGGKPLFILSSGALKKEDLLTLPGTKVL